MACHAELSGIQRPGSWLWGACIRMEYPITTCFKGMKIKLNTFLWRFHHEYISMSSSMRLLFFASILRKYCFCSNLLSKNYSSVLSVVKCCWFVNFLLLVLNIIQLLCLFTAFCISNWVLCSQALTAVEKLLL